MKHLLILLIAVYCCGACKNNKNKVTASANDSTVVNIVEASETQQKTDQLVQLNPYTSEQMKSLLPLALDGDSTDEVAVISNMGTNATRAIYHLGDTASVEVNVFDCGGSAGAGLYTQFMNQFSNPDGAKPVSFKGNKALEYTESGNNASLTYFDGERWLVVLDGKNTGIDKLKQMAGDIRLK